MAHSLTFTEGDLRTAVPERGGVVCIVGRAGSGKSRIACEIVADMLAKEPHKVMSFHVDEATERFLHKVVPAPDRLESDNGEAAHALATSDTKMPTIVLVDSFHSSVYDKLTMRRIEGLTRNGRHYHTTVILLTQDLMDVPPAIRDNIDLFVVTSATTKSLIRHLPRTPDLAALPKDRMFMTVCNKLTQGFNAMLVPNPFQTKDTKTTWIKATRDPSHPAPDVLEAVWVRQHFLDEDARAAEKAAAAERASRLAPASHIRVSL